MEFQEKMLLRFTDLYPSPKIIKVKLNCLKIDYVKSNCQNIFACEDHSHWVLLIKSWFLSNWTVKGLAGYDIETTNSIILVEMNEFCQKILEDQKAPFLEQWKWTV